MAMGWAAAMVGRAAKAEVAGRGYAGCGCAGGVGGAGGAGGANPHEFVNLVGNSLTD